jgi:hypothetical protein
MVALRCIICKQYTQDHLNFRNAARKTRASAEVRCAAIATSGLLADTLLVGKCFHNQIDCLLNPDLLEFYYEVNRSPSRVPRKKSN